jgi:hypothetical protein
MFRDIAMLFDPPPLFSILDYPSQNPGRQRITDSGELVTEAIWSDFATCSRALKYIIYLFPDWRFVCRILVIVDSSSLIEPECTPTISLVKVAFETSQPSLPKALAYINRLVLYLTCYSRVSECSPATFPLPSEAIYEAKDSHNIHELSPLYTLYA